MSIGTSEVDGVVVVRLAGELDMCSRADDEVRACITARPRGVVLDLRQVTFFGSHGISLLLGAVEEARTHGVGFAVVADNRPVLRPLEVTDMLVVVSVFATPETAVASMRRVECRTGLG
uniref:STAS domain-containing protein n=1 Tax=Saccharothrix mutabilis TaxID=33921 RepID=UPI0031D03C8B